MAFGKYRRKIITSKRFGIQFGWLNLCFSGIINAWIYMLLKINCYKWKHWPGTFNNRGQYSADIRGDDGKINWPGTSRSYDRTFPAKTRNGSTPGITKIDGVRRMNAFINHEGNSNWQGDTNQEHTVSTVGTQVAMVWEKWIPTFPQLRFF